MKGITFGVLFVTWFVFKIQAQTNLITNIQSRKSISLNGKWQYIVDTYETGFYDYRYNELK